MKIVLYAKHSQKTSTWSGGTTYELLIAPEHATLANRDFNLRISKASVNSSPSTFTQFPGLHRNLLLLKGCLLTQCNEQENYLLCPGDEWHFEGSDQVTAMGTCNDYNVMWKGEGVVHSQMIKIDKSNVYSIDQSVSGQMLFFHCDTGKVKMEILGEEFILTEGMSLEIDAIKEDLNLMIIAQKESTLIISEILLK
jgi:environmental stress-induced protein Ves